jgi:hypothetical protein
MFGGESEKRIPVTITMADGTMLTGGVPCGPAASLALELNREGMFLNLKDKSGQVMFIAKTSIARVQEGDKVAEARIPGVQAGQNAYKLLKLPESATSDMVRAAYMALARQYHPDLYAGEHIPAEVRDYATAMFQQITIAYNELKGRLSAAA